MQQTFVSETLVMTVQVGEKKEIHPIWGLREITKVH